MNNIILVQYFPLEHRIGRFAYSHIDCKNFYEEFRESVHASDPEHRSILMTLDNSDFKQNWTMNEIRNKCFLMMCGRW